MNGLKVSWIFICLVVGVGSETVIGGWSTSDTFFGQMLPCAWYHLTQRCILFWEISPKEPTLITFADLLSKDWWQGFSRARPVRHGRRRDICKILIVPVPGPSDPQNFHGVCQSAPGRS